VVVRRDVDRPTDGGICIFFGQNAMISSLKYVCSRHPTGNKCYLQYKNQNNNGKSNFLYVSGCPLSTLSQIWDNQNFQTRGQSVNLPEEIVMQYCFFGLRREKDYLPIPGIVLGL